ncbi:hypothetical protein GCM10010377_14930 [Streptomyces viridiviolaceus]|uniref:Secreted protein n=1 Tax=Streptomyces viridiviolaceus TaxID=68282 RepID=A0ABW2E389_9ACTN|nr:hypothetical protein [Streptomyces viridiviolaceus]GHB25915.1 hypothetical protein GCM10010377_14930 [Streptomyces viridiviolaceus]
MGPPPTGRRSAWLRALVLLLALLVPGMHTQAAQAAPAPVVAAESGGSGGGNGLGGGGGGAAVAEYDHLDTAPRLPVRDGRRAVVPRRAPVLTPAAPAHAALPSVPLPSGSPPSPRAPRSVVLRC